MARASHFDKFISTKPQAGTIAVMNADTGDLHHHLGTDPRLAVVAAFERSKGNHNTWTYDKDKARVSKSGRTVSCGDFIAMLN